MKKEAKKIFLRLLIPIIIGIGSIITGIFLIVENENYKKHTTETEAIITRIEQDNESTHNVYITFSVNGTEYSGILGTYGSGMKEGNSVNIRYEPDNPQNFRYSSISGWGLGMLLVGGAFFIIGMVSYKQYKRKPINNAEAALIQ